MARVDANTNLFVGLEPSKKAYKASERQELVFTLTNESDTELKVLKWHTPLEGLKSDMFHVEVAGKQVAYMGRVYKRGAPMEDDYVTIPPHKSLEQTIDLTEVYDIAQVGTYNVKYKTDRLQVGTEQPKVLQKRFLKRPRTASVTVKSNAAIFTLLEGRQAKTVNGTEIAFARRLAQTNVLAAAQKAPVFSSCTASQQTDLNNALTEATKIANAAKLALTSASYCAHFTAPRYLEWFGKYSDSRFNTVVQHYTNIADALANQTITFNCDCDDDSYAYVYPTKPYEIFLCKHFWTAPLTGTDSKAGTLVHEMSHFNVVASTDDNVYGQSNCRQLAKDDPAKAIDNADSHEYFAENTPILSMAAVAAPVIAVAGNWRNMPSGFTESFDTALNGAGPFAGKCYFFKGSNYIRYDWATDRADAGYPKNIAQNWHNLPAGFTNGFDAAINGQGPFAGKCYFFKGDMYIRYDWAADRVDPGYPAKIQDNWHNLPVDFKNNFDAIINGNGPFAGKCYFFKGDSYIRYDWHLDRTDAGYPRKIADFWNCLPSSFFSNFDASVEGDKQFIGWGYFFNGNDYVRYNWAEDHAE